MLKLGVFFGGRSCEHDVRVVTGHQAMENADKTRYQIIPVYLDPQGRWYTGEKLMDMKFFTHFDPTQVTQVYMEPNAGEHGLYPCQLKAGVFGVKKREPLVTLDAALLAMHGMHGEDGSLQGLFELCDLPYTSPGLMGSAVGMDKIAMRLLFQGAGFPVLPHFSCERGDFEADPEAILQGIEGALPGYPFFVKPANLGSSIGISKAKDREGLRNALEVAFHYDRRALVEPGLTCKEINCAALRCQGKVRASLCEEPVPWEEFLDFDSKYLHGGKNEPQGMARQARLLPAPIGEEMTARIRELTCAIYKTLNCRGVARVDFMIDEKAGALYVNEINTIPGSLAFYLFEPDGLAFPALLDAMVEDALQAQKEKNANSFAHRSSLLEKIGGGAKMGGSK